MAERWVVIGLAPARAAWFRDLARWATSGSVPVEFVKHQSAEELRATLQAGRPVSAALIDGSLPSIDRDLLQTAAAAGCPVVVVGPAGRDWGLLGAAAALPDPFDPGQLLDVLVSIAAPIDAADQLPGSGSSSAIPDRAPGRLFAVCGPGGTGASTVAVALAQGLATPNGTGRRGRRRPERTSAVPDVLLGDLCLHAEQAMLHDVRDALVGVEELVEVHRAGTPPVGSLRDLSRPVVERGYDLLVGLRRSRSWPAIRPRAFAAALNGLRTAWGTVVVDVDCDVEGEADGGSRDVEDRNAMARAALFAADAVLVVGSPGLKGTHALVRVLHDLAGAGVEPERLVPVISQSPKGASARAELTAAVASLAGLRTDRPHPVVHLPNRPIDAAFQDGVALPTDLAELLRDVVEGLVAQIGGAPIGGVEPEPVRVRPGAFAGLAGAGDDEHDDGWDAW